MRLLKHTTSVMLMLAITIAFMLSGTLEETYAASMKPAKVVIKSVISSDYDTIKITWKEAKDAKKYQVYRATSKNGKYKLVKTTTEKSFVNKKLTTGKKYYFKVRAVSGNQKGPFSVKKTVTPKLKKVVIQSISAKAEQITITYKKVSGAQKYQIYRATSKNGKYTLIGTTTKLSFEDKNYSVGKQYFYKVRAVRKVNGKNKYGAFGNVKSMRTKIDMMAIRIEMLNQINEERETAGVEPLKLYSPISVLAQIKAEDLYKTKVFDHYSKNLGYFNDQFDNAGITYDAGGENIAMGSATVTGVMDQWMNSPGHKANILSELYTHVGIGYYNGYWVQQFATEPFGGRELIEKDTFDCVYCGREMHSSDRVIFSNFGIGYDCPACEASVWKCMQCEDGFCKYVGIAKEGWEIALRCQTCGLDRIDNYVEFCPTCNDPIWDNYIQDNYKISFRYPDEDKRVWKEFLTSTYACKSCNTYAVAEAHDTYNEYYEKLKAVLPEGENIYDYILWQENIGYEEIEDGETEVIGGMEMTPVGRDLYGPDFSWPMETLDDIAKYKYKYSPAQ